jgi:hypothetical protein
MIDVKVFLEYDSLHDLNHIRNQYECGRRSVKYDGKKAFLRKLHWVREEVKGAGPIKEEEGVWDFCNHFLESLPALYHLRFRACGRQVCNQESEWYFLELSGKEKKS